MIADFYRFLTTEANRTVDAIHPKAMPVILTTQEEWQTWLQRPLPDGALAIVAEEERQDSGA